ncbi:MAG: hypothetical protein M3Q57_10210 [Pseudomonadota bacterium]|nr:hypothetical protein [Pseudomonadota bacterium]
MRCLLLVLTVLTAAPAQAEWWEAKTDQFIVYSESPSSETRKFAEDLERFDMALRSLQNIKFSPATSDSRRLTVFRSGNIDDIGRLAGSAGVAGFYVRHIGGSVAFTPVRGETRTAGSIVDRRRDKRTDLDPKSVLFHEYAHHFMFQHLSAAYPSWYVEGFAETAATIDLRDDGSFHLGNPPQYRSDSLFDNMLTISAERLLTNTDEPNGLDYYNRYTVGWLLNHYLTFDPSREGQLKSYLLRINTGTEPAAAARQAFGDLRKLDQDLIRYRNSRRLGGANVRTDNYSPPKVVLRKLTPDEEAVMPVKMRSKSGVSRKEADGVARDAQAIAERHPRSFAAQLAHAEAEFDAAQFEPAKSAPEAAHLGRAEVAADRALALRPGGVEALLYKGLVLMERGKHDAQQLPAARSWFAKAHAADPEHPGPLYQNYMAWFLSGAAIPESALIDLERAYEFAPFSAELRMVLARQLLAEKKGSLARSVLLPQAIAPHESKGAKKVRKVVDLIEAKKVDEAHRLLAGDMAEQERKQKSGGDD